MSSRFFILYAIIYLLVGFFSLSFHWFNADAVWNVAVATRLLSFDPYSYFHAPNPTSPIGSSPVNYTPLLLFIIYPFVVVGGLRNWGIDQIASVYPLALQYIDLLTI